MLRFSNSTFSFFISYEGLMLSLTYVGKMIILIWQTSADRLWISEYPVVRNKIFTSLKKKREKKELKTRNHWFAKIISYSQICYLQFIILHYFRAKGGCNNCWQFTLEPDYQTYFSFFRTMVISLIRFLRFFTVDKPNCFSSSSFPKLDLWSLLISFIFDNKDMKERTCDTRQEELMAVHQKSPENWNDKCLGVLVWKKQSNNSYTSLTEGLGHYGRFSALVHGQYPTIMTE